MWLETNGFLAFIKSRCVVRNTLGLRRWLAHFIMFIWSPLGNICKSYEDMVILVCVKLGVVSLHTRVSIFIFFSCLRMSPFSSWYHEDSPWKRKASNISSLLIKLVARAACIRKVFSYVKKKLHRGRRHASDMPVVLIGLRRVFHFASFVEKSSL